MPAFITRPDGTCLFFDLTEEERHAGIAEVTRFPVEDGLPVSDNVRVEGAPFTMRCMVTNTPLVPSGNQSGTTPGFMSSNVSGQVDITVQPYTAQVGALATAASALINPLAAITNAIFPQEPKTYPMPVLKFPEEFDAVVDTLFILDAMQNAGDLLEITTSVAIYSNYVLEHYELVRNSGTGDGAEVDMTFREITIVTTKSAAQPYVSQPNATPPKKKGTQSVTPAPVKMSIISNAASAGGSNFFTGAAQNASGGQLAEGDK